MNYVNPYALGSDSSIASYMSTLEDGGYNSYAQGYLATAYLGYVCGGAGAVDSNTIGQGINNLLKDIADGKSLSQAIAERSDGKYESLTDFTERVESGDVAMCQFVKAFKAAVGSGAGSATMD